MAAARVPAAARPRPGGAAAAPGQKVKSCTLSDEHRAINGMLLAVGFRPLQRGDWPASLVRVAPPELLANAPLAGHGLRIDRAVVSEPFGLVPYGAVYR
jgi:hypothetical protein